MIWIMKKSEAEDILSKNKIEVVLKIINPVQSNGVFVYVSVILASSLPSLSTRG